MPHTHWDREWYEPESVLRGRLVALLDDVVDRLSRDAGLVFLLDGQASLIDDYLRIRPEQRRVVRHLVGAGRLEVGPWYVLADELLAGDEPLVRNLLVGRDVSAALGGWLSVGYSPDAFGHPAALPTILAGFGIESAVLWRGYGGEPGEEGDLFRWEAPSGATVLVHHLPPDGYEIGAELPADRAALGERWRTIAAVLAPRALAPALYVPNGADHHAMQPDLPDVVASLRAIAPEHEFVIGSPADYFDLAKSLYEAAPLVRGELRFSARHTWTLQGVAATRARLKAAIARGGALLRRWAEPQVALASGEARATPHPVLNDVWREHLLNLSHDVLAGTVADPVADDASLRARHVAEAARALMDTALTTRLGQDPTLARREGRVAWEPALIAVNPSPAPRGGVLEATVTRFVADVVVGRPPDPQAPEIPDEFHLLDPNGAVVPFQLLGAYDAMERLDAPRAYPDQDRVRAVRVAVAAPPVPALGLLRLSVVSGAREAPTVPDPVTLHRRALRNDAVRAAVVPGRGFAVRYSDGPTWNDAVRLESEADRGDTYTFEPVAGDAPVRAKWHGARVVSAGPLIGALAYGFTVGGRARGTVYLRLDAGSRLVRLVVEGENLAAGHRLRIGVPVPEPADATLADMLYGPTTRDLRRHDPTQYPKEWPVATAPMHRYVSAGGVTLLARDRFEYEMTPRGLLFATLFRSVSALSRDDLGARPGHAAWPMPTPGAEERGPFRAELAIAPISLDEAMPPERWAGAEQLAEEFHAPLAGWMLRHGIRVPDRVKGPALEGAGLAFKAAKPREDGPGIVVRAANVTGATVQGAWTWPGPLKRAYRARLDETVQEEIALDPPRRVVRFAAAPREVVTIIVEP
ncbi:MAG TPA: glycosyl hydrolase-related protein [Gemmatimonadales bacterium]|nr:glycosyl hydrolase-related protein [Gemmatimonadales bacterium]